MTILINFLPSSPSWTLQTGKFMEEKTAQKKKKKKELTETDQGTSILLECKSPKTKGKYPPAPVFQSPRPSVPVSEGP